MRETTEGISGNSEGRGWGNEISIRDGNKIREEVHVNHPHSMNCIGNGKESAGWDGIHTV